MPLFLGVVSGFFVDCLAPPFSPFSDRMTLGVFMRRGFMAGEDAQLFSFSDSSGSSSFDHQINIRDILRLMRLSLSAGEPALLKGVEGSMRTLSAPDEGGE
ncbi:MAG: uncharacterized protein KVP18_003349 [Porospora cf. gigantea A]|uniref:uncharacterized protein n=1 Tax=Porospora cf. gigantea A TaxID=2853593 RepID=UPI003559EDC8|nr:MAG: hypothetical protein KVP18_003349 [Porospora cf. gigantea A]